ncbi:MAG: M14 family metallopeptidase [Gemmatimonadota bacterium]
MLEPRWNRGSLEVAAAVVILAACALPLPAAAQAPAYLPFAALTDELEELVDASNRASIRSLGLSGGGREIWLVEVLGPGAAPAAERPGILVVANLEADHLIGSQLALEILRDLVEGDGSDAGALTDRVVYLVPRLNPDGAEGMFGSVLADGSGNRRPFDDDNDGRTDEDPPGDLNGDGLITLMRVPDPLGAYVVHEDDPRLVQEADPAAGRAGTLTLYWEGADTDGDGFLNEDGVGGVDLNRNFQHVYPYYERDAGPHMVSEPESRALIDFVIAHRNIAAILTFGHSDNLVSPVRDNGGLAPATVPDLPAFAQASLDEIFNTGIFGAGTASGGIQLRGTQVGADNNPESGRRPETEVHDDDIPYFTEVSELYREVTGIERVSLNREPEGAFFQYGYFHFGVPSFTTQGWALSEPEEDVEEADQEEEEAGAPGFEGEALRALEALGVDAFVDWAPFDHPEFGPVEIGGFRPYALTNPPADQIPALGDSHGAFLLRLAELLPRIAIVETEVESHGGGLFTISAEVANEGFFPTALRHGVVAGSVDPVTVQIEVPLEDLVTGDQKSSQIPTLAGSGTRQRFEWVIRGTPGESIEIRARAQKGGTDTVTVLLGGDE